MVVERPWGHYVVIHANDSCKVKLITINPHSRLSLQRHKYRAEFWHVIDGTASVVLDNYQFKLSAGENLSVPVGMIHRIGAYHETVRFIEVQTGSYFGEDDIERLDDDYDRI